MKAKNTIIPRSVRTALAACALVAVSLPVSAFAGTVFQSVADLNDVSKIDTYGWCSSCGNGWRVFDQFSLASAESITGFSVSLYAGSPYWPTNVNFSIWSDGGSGLAGVQLFSQDFAAVNFNSTSISGAAIPSIIASTSDVAGLTLAAGSYYVSFFNSGYLAVNGYTGGGGMLNQSGVPRNDSAGFTLSNDGSAGSNAVPEPASLALVCLGVLGIGAFTRRRRS